MKKKFSETNVLVKQNFLVTQPTRGTLPLRARASRTRPSPTAPDARLINSTPQYLAGGRLDQSEPSILDQSETFVLDQSERVSGTCLDLSNNSTRERAPTDPTWNVNKRTFQMFPPVWKFPTVWECGHQSSAQKRAPSDLHPECKQMGFPDVSTRLGIPDCLGMQTSKLHPGTRTQ